MPIRNKFDSNIGGDIMKMLFHRHKALSLILIVAIIIIILYLATLNVQEVFSNAGKIFEVIFQISIGYIINFIFFVVNIYVPNNSSQVKALSVTRLSIASLLEEIRRLENIFDSFVKLNYGRISFQLGTIYYKYPDSAGRSYIDVTQYIKSESTALQRHFDRLCSIRYFHSLDCEIIELINDLQYCDFQGYLKRFLHVEGDPNQIIFGQNKYIKSLSESYEAFIVTANKLLDKCDLEISSRKKFIVLEGTELDEYIAFIDKTRSMYSAEASYGELYVENSRIY